MHTVGSVLFEKLRSQLWVVPTVAASLAAVFALAVIWVDGATDTLGGMLDISEDSARAVLAAISGAMISFTALVFTVTMLVLQLASTQLSPRVTRTFLRDRFNQAALGLFIATFVFALLVLASVRADQVPQLGVVASIALVLVAVLAFVAYIDHMAHAMRATSVIAAIAAETHDSIERCYPDAVAGDTSTGSEAQEASHGDTPGRVVTWSGPSGYIQSVDETSIAAFAADHGHPLELLAGAGCFLDRDAPIMRLYGGANETVRAEDVGLADAVVVGDERTMAEDPEFGFRQLVDVALRALSPGLNDVSTAGHAIDRLHALLRQLQSVAIRSPRRWRADDGPLVTMPAPDWDAYIELAVVEIGEACRSMPQVTARLRQALEDLLSSATSDQLAVIRRMLAQLESPDGRGDAR